MRSKLSQQQILQSAFDENSQTLKTSGGLSGEMAIEIDSADGDNIAILSKTKTPDPTFLPNAATDSVVDVIDISEYKGYAIQVIYSSIDSTDGVIHLEASLDNINYNQVGDSQTINSTDGSLLFNSDGAFYKYVRVVYTSNSVTSGTLSVNSFLKG